MTKIQIGNAVKKARVALKFSFYKVGKLTSTNPGQIVNLERGDSSYTIDLLIKVCKVLNISVNVGETITIETAPKPVLALKTSQRAIPRPDDDQTEKPAASKADRLKQLKGRGR